MIKRLFTAVGASLLLTSLGVAQSTPLSLDSVLSTTRQNYPTLAQGELTQASGVALREALWYAYIPQVSLEGRTHYQTDVTAMELKLKPAPEGEQTFPPDEMMKSVVGRIEMPGLPKFQYDAYVQVSQLLWDGGRVSAGARQVDANTAVELSQQKQEYEQVASAVQELYFALLMLDAQAKSQQVMMDELARQQTRVSNAIKNGVATQNDYDEVSLEVLHADQTMQTLQDSRSAVLRALGVYMGRELSPETTAEVPAYPILPAKKIGTDSHRQRIAPKRAVHALLDAQGDLADARYSSALADGMPTFALFARGGYGRPGLNMLNPQAQPYFMYGATFSWNLGGLYSIGKQRQVRTNTHRLIELKRDAFELATQAKLAEQQKDIDQYRRMLQTDEEILSLRKRISDRAEIQAEEGTITTTERLQKLSAYTVAQQTLDTHRIQLLRAIYAVKNTLGE